METFDWRPPVFYFRICKEVVDGARVTDNRYKTVIHHFEYQSQLFSNAKLSVVRQQSLWNLKENQRDNNFAFLSVKNSW